MCCRCDAGRKLVDLLARAGRDNVVLYIGQAVNIRRRMNDHLDDPRKTDLTPQGRAFFFYWLEYDDIGKLERTWLNIHGEHEPRYPILNSVNSPVSV